VRVGGTRFISNTLIENLVEEDGRCLGGGAWGKNPASTAGPRLRPRMVEDKAESVCFHMNAEGPREPNCEAIILAMEHGKVRSKWYSAD
jgi:hypothetical protein